MTDWRTQFPDGVPLGELAEKMGIEIRELTRDRCVATMPVEGNRQPYGLLHGGASAVLAETMGSIASAVHAGPDRVVVGIELSCSHHRAATEGTVTAVAVPLSLGRTLATYEIAISDEREQRLCTARLTCLVRSAPGPAGSPAAGAVSGG